MVAEKFGPFYTCDTAVNCIDDNTFTAADGIDFTECATAGDSCYKNLGTCDESLACTATKATAAEWCQANPYKIRADGVKKAKWQEHQE